MRVRTGMTPGTGLSGIPPQQVTMARRPRLVQRGRGIITGPGPVAVLSVTPIRPAVLAVTPRRGPPARPGRIAPGILPLPVPAGVIFTPFIRVKPAQVKRQPRLLIRAGMTPGSGLSGIPVPLTRSKPAQVKRQPKMTVRAGMTPGSGLSGIPVPLARSKPARVQRQPKMTVRGGMVPVSLPSVSAPARFARLPYHLVRRPPGQLRAGVAVPGTATSPAMITSGFGTFPQVPAGSVILSVIASVTQHGSDVSIGAPSYELWDGTAAIIGTAQPGTASTSVSNVDSAVFTGVAYSQLATLQLRVYGSALAADRGGTVSVDAVGLAVEWAPNLNALATPAALAVVPQFPAATASGVVNTAVTPGVLAVVPAFPPASAGLQNAAVTPAVLAVVPQLPAVSASTGTTASPGVLAVIPVFPLASAGFLVAAVTPGTLQVVPQFPPVTASGVVNSTASPGVLAVIPAFPPASAGLQNAAVTPAVLAVVPVFPAATASGVVNAAVTPGVLAVVPAFPAIIDITAPGYATADSTPGGGWTSPGNVLGPPDGSDTVWTVP